VAKFLVQKSAPLRGEVTISGSKNAVLPIMAATLLAEGECVIKDVPALRDVEVMCKLLESFGAKTERDIENGRVTIDASGEISYEAPFDLVKMMRASILVLGALILRTGRAIIPLPGGCAIGKRPIELHLKGLKALGVVVDEEQLQRGVVDARADKLVGTTIYLDFPSVGATEVIIMAAANAEGTTILENAAQEPEIVDLANFLNKMGARIKGAGTDTIKIEGGGYRMPSSEETLRERVVDEHGNIRSLEHGYMDGDDVFNFVASKVPKDIKYLCSEVGEDIQSMDYYLLHQANDFMNQFLVKKLKLDEEKVPSSIAKFGNTSSVSIPLTIVSELHNQLSGNKKLMLSAFGVGLSWGTVILQTQDCHVFPLVEI
jgi:hypothetical protein